MAKANREIELEIAPAAVLVEATRADASPSVQVQEEMIYDLRAMCRARTVEAVLLLEEIMNDEDAPRADRIKCAVALLDRGWGRPTEFVEVVDRTPRAVTIHVPALPDLGGK